MSILLGPQIDLTDCVLYLDAKNPGSYNGIGSTWYDCSGNNNHFTLTGITQPDWDGSKISFNTAINAGKNQYTLCTNTTCGNFGSSSFSIEIVYIYDNPPTSNQGNPWPYPGLITKRFQVTNKQNGNPGFFWNPVANIYVGDGQTAASTGQLNTLLGNNEISTLSPTFNTIVYQTLTIERNGLQVTGSLYTNAILYNDNLQYTYTNGGNITNNLATQLFFSSGEGVYITGSIYSVRMYNRVLNQSEIANNYNVYRQYYGF